MAHTPQTVDENPDAATPAPSIVFCLLGTMSYDGCVRVQREMIEAARLRDDGRVEILLCEHPPIITVGRQGSRRHIRIPTEELRQRSLDVRWVHRNGGCVLHAPGQLAIHAVVPLRWLGWTATGYEQRLRQGIVNALSELNIETQNDDAHGLSGRSGQLAQLGFGVQDGFAHHGAFLNVHPTMEDFAHIDLPSGDVRNHRSALDSSAKSSPPRTMSSLLSEHRQPVRMASVRAVVTEHLAAAFGTCDYHVRTGWRL